MVAAWLLRFHDSRVSVPSTPPLLAHPGLVFSVIKEVVKLNEPFVNWVNALALLAFWVVLHILGFLSLKHLHREQR